jgi:hypothetical protein
MGGMKATELLSDLAQRVVEAADSLPELTNAQLNAHPAGHPNSIVWLLWHSGREIDVQLQQLTGNPQAWDDFKNDLKLGDIGDSVGLGHTPDEAAEVTSEDQKTLVAYVGSTVSKLRDYIDTLSEEELDDIIDRNWTPPVTRGVRILSIISDALQHLGQAAYVAGTSGSSE